MEQQTVYAVYTTTGPGYPAFFATRAEADQAAQDAGASCPGHVWRVFEAFEVAAFMGREQPAQVVVVPVEPLQSLIPMPEPTPDPDGNQ